VRGHAAGLVWVGVGVGGWVGGGGGGWKGERGGGGAQLQPWEVWQCHVQSAACCGALCAAPNPTTSRWEGQGSRAVSGPVAECNVGRRRGTRVGQLVQCAYSCSCSAVHQHFL
jgi:hypothetical protein